MIEITHLHKRYGSQPVLRDVTARVVPGTVTALIGANGSGKSTLLSAVGRLIPFEAGRIDIAGTGVHDWHHRELARMLSILRQAPRLDLRLTVEEVVEFGRFPHNEGPPTDEDRAAIEDALGLMSLREIRDRSIHELSGGQRQRAFIAMVIAQETRYVLLDEPLNNLDMKYAGRVMAVLTTLAHRRGRAVVVVLHDINMAAAYADTVVALRDGEVVHVGSVEDTMTETVLERVYGVPFPVVRVGERPFCVYHTHPASRAPEQAPEQAPERAPETTPPDHR